jgi:hypothetical protein
MTFPVFTGNSIGYDSMPLFPDSEPPTPPTTSSSDNTMMFNDMVEKYMDLNECEYTVLPTANVESCNSWTTLQKTILLGKLPWYTSLPHMFESAIEFIKV